MCFSPLDLSLDGGKRISERRLWLRPSYNKNNFATWFNELAKSPCHRKGEKRAGIYYSSEQKTRTRQGEYFEEGKATISPVTPAMTRDGMHRLVEFGPYKTFGSEEKLTSAKTGLGEAVILKVLESLKDVMDDTLGDMNRNTAAIVEIGGSVTNLDMALRLDNRMHRGPPTIRRTEKGRCQMVQIMQAIRFMVSLRSPGKPLYSGTHLACITRFISVLRPCSQVL